MELWGVLAAIMSSALGGAAVGATRFIAGQLDPLAIGAFRFGIGVLLLAPLTLRAGNRWPARADWLRTIGLGLLFFALFPVLFNASLQFTTAARGALALSTLPLLTMAVAALSRVEMLTRRKTFGVLLAMAGVAFALLAGLGTAPAGAWRGDALMVAAALCMALYSVWSRPVIRRSGPISFTVAAMGVGAVSVLAICLATGRFEPVTRFHTPQWLALAYLAVFGGAVGFFLWSFALAHTTPTRVAIAVTVNPVAAGLVGAALLGEPIGWNLVIGLIAVFAGIWIASFETKPKIYTESA